MALREEFTDSIRKAEEARQQKPERRPFLHQAIAGPSQSGKTFLAHQYMDELVKRNLAEGRYAYFEPPRFSGQDPMKKVNEAKGGFLIFDDLSGREAEHTARLIEDTIRMAIIKNECTLILLGTHDGLKRFTWDDALAARMNKMIVITEESPLALQHPITVKKKPFTLRTRGRKEEIA